ncbi:hypothetical protein GGX14DRAFT_643203 [Mycena pura]|uniref:Uncharacterized protein n=1 Tax=Mycena pura TaxID=153505 RepID=A0AAD6Y7V4_9AGAR|nr:hypothetical protein GGX14DRAFT_643203 [Mycena pura]
MKLLWLSVLFLSLNSARTTPLPNTQGLQLRDSGDRVDAHLRLLDTETNVDTVSLADVGVEIGGINIAVDV